MKHKFKLTRLWVASLLLLVGVSQPSWAAVSVKSTSYVYFNPSDNSWDSYSYIYLTIGDAWGWKMKSVLNTKLVVCSTDEYNNSGIRLFAPTADWGDKNTNMAGWKNMKNNALNITDWYGSDWTFNNGDYTILNLNKKGSTSELAKITPTYIGNSYSSMNKSITIKAKIGGSEANTPGKLTASSYKFSAYNTCGTTSSADLNAGSASATCTVGYTAKTTLTAADVTGYTFNGWYNGSTLVNSSKSVTVYPTGGETYYASYTEKTFSVTAAKGTGCASVNPTGAQTVGQITGKEFTATGETGYHFVNWTSSNGGSFSSSTSETTTFKPTVAATITANYTENTFSVSATYGEGGASASVTTSPAGQVTGTAIDAVADDGYVFVRWDITSGAGTFGSERTTANNTFFPTEETVLNAVFSLATVTVTSGKVGEGTLTAMAGDRAVTIGTDNEIMAGSTVVFTATPTAGYKVVGFYSDAECESNLIQEPHQAEGAVETYTISAISEDASVYVKFDYIDYTIAMAVNPSGKGTITPSSVTQAHINVPFTISASNTEGYTFNNWTSTDNITITTGGTTTATLTNVTGDKTITANFTEDMHSVAVVSENTSKGTVSTASVSGVGIDTKSGDIIATPNPGYYFTGWDIPSGVTLAVGYTNKSATIKINATADEKTITANFAERFYLRGSIQNKADTETGGMPGWGEDAKTDGLFNSINGNTATITMSLSAATEYKLKLGDLQGDCSWGGSNEFTNDADLWTFACNAKNDCAAPTFRTSIAGDYTFTIDFSAASPKMKITYPDVPDFTLSVARARVYDETPMATFIAGNGTEESPYQFYLDEKMTLTVTALSPVTGVTAYYKFGDDAESSTVLTKDITAANTTVQSIVVKTYYRGSIGSYTSAEKTDTIWYQGVAVPALHLHSSLTNDEVEQKLAPDNVTIYYTTDYYSDAAAITKNGAEWKPSVSGIQQYVETLGGTIHKDTYVATATPNGRTFTTSLVVSVYRYVQVKVKDVDPKWASHLYMWNSVSGKKNAEWPGEALTTQLGDWYIFAVKYPTYDKFVVNDGKTTGKQTIDLDIPAEDICYEIGAFKEKRESKDIYNCVTGTCPNGLYVGDIANVEMYNGESATASPVVQLDPTLDEKNLQIAFSYSNSGIVTATQSGTKIMLSAIKAGTTTVTATYSITGAESVSKNFTVTVEGAVMIQAKYSESGLGWGGADMHIHYWGTDIDKTIDLTWKGKVGEISQVYARIPLDKNNQINFQIYAWNMDNDKQWHITNDVTNVTESGCYEITSDGDGKKRNITRTGDYCWAEYQVKIVMNNGTVYTSNTIGDISETLSFFAPGENAIGYNRGDVYLMCNGSQAAVIPASTFSTSGVYTAKTDGSALTNVALYTGDYYIRTDGASGGWDHYKEADKDNKFVKFDAIETSTYDHYWVKNIKQNSLNLQACVGNDYNENLANKIEASNYTDGVGNVTPDDKGVNLRFGYSPLTNNFERAIIKGSSTDEFLNVIGANVYKEKACSTALNTQNADSKFEDKEQWIYEKTVYVKIDGTHISADAKLQSKAYNNQVMYQLGYEIDPITGKPTSTPKTFGLIAAGTTPGTYAIKLVYDFKTNRMVSGWSPSEDPINGKIVLDADMLLVRNHQNSAAQIKFATNSSAIQQIRHIYGVMEIEKEKIQDENISQYERHLYWISFPFDVKISSIFGVGTYGVEWKLQRYDGAERASKGWFLGDGTTTFWKNMTIDETLKANEGYILNLKPSAFDYDNCPVWDNKRTIATFYFPSVDGNVGIINQATYEQTILPLECKIDREFEVTDSGGNTKKVNHKNTDSHWNVIGVPAFENAEVSTQEGSQDFKSYYAWDASANTYSAGIVSGTEFKAMHAYMVQFYGKIIWSNVSVVSKAPYAYADDKNYTIELFFNGNGAEDHTYIKLADEAATDFVLNEDMMKIDNAGYPNIYSFAGNYNVAYNETKMIDQVVTIGVSAPKDGSYTFSMPKDFSGTAQLVDLEEGTFTDLNVSNYSVDLNKGTYNNRFQLMLEVEAKIPTNIENANGGLWSEDGKTKKLLINDQIYLINAGRIYNATGAELR